MNRIEFNTHKVYWSHIETEECCGTDLKFLSQWIVEQVKKDDSLGWHYCSWVKKGSRGEPWSYTSLVANHEEKEKAWMKKDWKNMTLGRTRETKNATKRIEKFAWMDNQCFISVLIISPKQDRIATSTQGVTMSESERKSWVREDGEKHRRWTIFKTIDDGVWHIMEWNKNRML